MLVACSKCKPIVTLALCPLLRTASFPSCFCCVAGPVTLTIVGGINTFRNIPGELTWVANPPWLNSLSVIIKVDGSVVPIAAVKATAANVNVSLTTTDGKHNVSLLVYDQGGRLISWSETMWVLQCLQVYLRGPNTIASMTPGLLSVCHTTMQASSSSRSWPRRLSVTMEDPVGTVIEALDT